MPQEHDWQPLQPADIAHLFRSAPFSWWIAGGYCIEHFVGRPLRRHRDIDILVLHREYVAVRSFLAAWDCQAVDPPGSLRPWAVGEVLPDEVHDIWCRQTPDGPWRFQLMLDDSDRTEWRSRRCARVAKPLAELGWMVGDDSRFLVPEVQLFYKAKAPRAKDLVDWDACLHLLNAAQKTWLRQSIAAAYGSDHAWLDRLRPAVLAGAACCQDRSGLALYCPKDRREIWESGMAGNDVTSPWRVLYHYWRDKHVEGQPPCRAGLDPPLEIPQLLRNICLVTVMSSGLRYRLVGTAIVEHIKLDLTGRAVADSSRATEEVRFDWRQRLLAVAESQDPELIITKFPESVRAHTHSLVLPLVGPDRRTEQLLIGIFFGGHVEPGTRIAGLATLEMLPEGPRQPPPGTVRSNEFCCIAIVRSDRS